MISSKIVELQIVKAVELQITEDTLSVELDDGRAISVPLAWYPRLTHGSIDERNSWEFIGNGTGIHWPQLDADISINNLLFGQPSGESQRSFKRWLQGRQIST